MKGPITFPPVIWLALLTAAAAFVQEQLPFPEYWWSPGVVIILGAVAKLVEIYSPQKTMERGYLWTGRAWKFFIGGQT